MHQYSHLINAFCETAWAIQREKLDAIIGLINLRAAGGRVSDAEIQAIAAANRAPSARSAGAAYVIPIYGLISQRMTLMTQFSGGTSTQQVSKMLRQAVADQTVHSVILDIDSPGGSISGVQELSDEVYSSRKQKKIVAVCNSLMASAAYWIGSAATEVVCTPSGFMGSIGVFMVHEDYSKANDQMGIKPTYISAGKYKVEGNPDEPLTDEARQSMQADVNTIYTRFVRQVARNRGVSESKVQSDFGQGRCLLSTSAQAAGMCDRIATFDQVIAPYGASKGGASAYRARKEIEARRLELKMQRLGATLPRQHKQVESMSVHELESYCSLLETQVMHRDRMEELRKK